MPSELRHRGDDHLRARLLEGFNLGVAVIPGQQRFCPGQHLALVAFDVDLDNQRLIRKGQRVVVGTTSIS
jgi:hypothetical protein